MPAGEENGITTDILVVGAGPTGLALATTLARAGVAHLVVDKLARGQNTSRAAVLHAHTLDVLHSLGVSDRLREAALQLTRFSIRDRDRLLLRLRFDTLPSRYACLLMLPQERTEKILAEALHAAGGRVHWSTTAETLAESGDGVVATVSGPNGRREIRARYVVGADGMASLVRQTAGIGFTGSTYEESFVLADVDMAWAHGRDEVMLFFSPAGLVVVAPLPEGRFRIVATLDDAPEQPGVADVQALLDARGPTRGRATVSRVHWSSRFRLHHRVADAYRRGPFMLVGDAAHVHSPAGGQGMNTGLVDACVLGRLLADVLHGRRDDAALDGYGDMRRPAARQVLRLTGRLTSMATMQHAPQRMLRNMALRIVDALPVARRQIAMNLSGLARRAAAELPDVPGSISLLEA
jgi:2-polyprenyl-6-methoxyphenol hydroxylase-like FAD-dependent oxidoreductase